MASVDCQQLEPLLHAYVDGELDLSKTLEIEEHLRACSACAQTQRSIQTLQSRVRSEGVYFTPPAHLRARVRTSIGDASPARLRARLLARPWLALAASLLLVSMTALGFLRLLPGRSGSDALTDELFASHFRSQMLARHLVDVESSDQHTVKPWFEGKLSFAPEVPDLTAEGFVLIGGRLDYAGHRPAAVLVYQRGKHIINLFIWASDSGSEKLPDAVTRQGHHLLSWTRAGLTYCAVSDLNEAELREFAELFQNRSH
jgi:anti-sigma factor RsiW